MMIQTKFDSSGSLIKGYFFPAEENHAIASIIFLQGFPGIEGDELICERLAKANVNVLTFNYQGIFKSKGFFSFSNAISDIGAAIQFIKESRFREKYHIDMKNIILGGWSFGSGLVPTGAIRNAAISRIFCISGRDFGAEARRIDQNPEYKREVFSNLESIRKPVGSVNFKDNVLDDLIKNQEMLDPRNLTPGLKDYEILLVGGWNDEVSSLDDHLIPFYRSLIEYGNQRVHIEALNTDHEFSNHKSQLVKLIVDWIKSSGKDQSKNEQ